MLTALGDEIDKVLGLEMGADDYMTKPYSLRELLSRLRALLRRAYGEFSTSPDADLLYVRDLVLDRGSGVARRGDDVINLSPIEFRLLVFLAQHSGQALTRGQIVQSVWGYEADPDGERSVNVHIRRLREKVELDPSRPDLILTVPGVGYRLAEAQHRP
jgi:DNA-binding response OmpR family regulator